MTDPRQEALLAQWLDDPSSGPPEGLENDVVESMIALRPELAPAPGVSLDDILAGVTEGPFTARSDAPVSLISDEELEARRSEMPPSQAEIIDLAAARRRRRRIWGAVGTLAAAALVLFIIVPQSFDGSVDAPAPADVLTEPSPQVEPPATAFDEGAPEGQAREDATEKNEGATERKNAPKPATVEIQTEREEAAQPEPAPLKSSAVPSTYGPAPEEAPLSPEPAMDWDEPAKPSAGSVSMEADEAVGDGSRKRDRNKSRSSRAPMNDDGLADYEMGEEEEVVQDVWIPSDLESLRAAAAPRDYIPDWYLSALSGVLLDEVSGAVNEAESQASQGDYRAAAKTCLALAKSSDPRVAQDMAWRAARYTRMAGDSGALAIARDGQRRSSANTAFRANLYHLEGSILESQGDIEGALEAYRIATNLNAAR